MRVRKRPVEIEAFLVHAPSDETRELPPHWLVDALVSKSVIALQTGGLMIKTLEGAMYCPVGHWIMRGVEGELYPCAPGIFEQTYDILEN